MCPIGRLRVRSVPWKQHELNVGRDCPQGTPGPVNRRRSRCWAGRSRIPLYEDGEVSDGDVGEGTLGRGKGMSKGLGFSNT